MSTLKVSELNLFSDKLKYLRGKRTKAAFARDIGVSPPLVHQWENGATPTVDKAGLIARACNVTVEWLMNGVGEPPKAEIPINREDQVHVAIAALHEKIDLQAQIIDSQKQTIESQKQTIETLQQTLVDVKTREREGRAPALDKTRASVATVAAGGTRHTA